MEGPMQEGERWSADIPFFPAFLHSCNCSSQSLKTSVLYNCTNTNYVKKPNESSNK